MRKIKVTVDTAHAFDMLSILAIKKQDAEHEELLSEITEQISPEISRRVISSEEYEQLRAANEALYNAIDDIKSNKITASEFDQLNRQRFIKKKELQSKFFGDMTEMKIWKN